MANNPDRFDILNKERLLDILCGESKLELGTVAGTYRGEPCELLVMVVEELDDDDITVTPLAAFLSEDGLSHIDIEHGAGVDIITFEPEEESNEEELDLEKMKIKGLLH